MGHFRYHTGADLSITECDHIAIEKAGVIDQFGFGYDCPRGADINEEYSSCVINKQGMGNHGFLILRGRTPRARAALREGKAQQLVGFGVSLIVARKCAIMKYGMEPEVADLADALYGAFLSGLPATVSIGTRSHEEFDRVFGGVVDIPPGMSFSRKEAALRIARAAADLD
jgi:hypothetical protein